MQRGNASLMVGANSWKDQFFDAFTVQAGDDEEGGEEGEEVSRLIIYRVFMPAMHDFHYIKSIMHGWHKIDAAHEHFLLTVLSARGRL